MSISRKILAYLLANAGEKYATADVMRGAGLPDKSGSGSALLLGLLQRNCVARTGEKWSYLWFVPDNAAAKARAQAYLDRPEGGRRDRDAVFNGGPPQRRARSIAPDETPLEHAAPPTTVRRAVYPPEPLQFFVDNDGDMQVNGKITGTSYLLIPKLDAMLLLAFARAAAGVIERGGMAHDAS